jgi:hypothetical protein
MRIEHRRLDIFVAQPFLHGPDVVALLEQVRRNAVPQGMTTNAFGEPSHTTGPMNGSWPPTLMGVMSADDSRAGISRQPVRGKHIWPDPEAACVRICAFQRKRSGDRGDPLRDILRMSSFDVREMLLEGGD